MKQRKFPVHAARALQKGEEGFFSQRARSRRKLFPSHTIVVKEDTLEFDNKLTLKTAVNLGKRDIIEYLYKVYGAKTKKIGVVNVQGKRKKVINNRRRGTVVKMTPTYKKFYVTLSDDSLLPEQRLEAKKD